MPVEKGQRLKLLKIWEILRQETDEAHPMSGRIAAKAGRDRYQV